MKPVLADKSKYWESRILKDLAFIKQHRRFPISRRTIAPLTVFATIVLLSLRLLWPVLIFRSKTASLPYFIAAAIIVPLIIAIYQYINILRFAQITTPFRLAENRDLVIAFLKQQQLAYAVHPDAPEVIQIMSRNLSTTKGESREIMVFIADDKRILVNSHFITSGFTIMPPSRNYKKMANQLHQWLKNHRSGTDTAITNINRS